jgi:hypothetical protein
VLYDDMNASAGAVFGTMTSGAIGVRDGMGQLEGQINRILAASLR